MATYLNPGARTTRALSNEGHAIGIPTESIDVLLNPSHRQLLVRDACVAAAFSGVHGRELPECQVAQDAETVVHGHDDAGMTAHDVVEWAVEVPAHMALHTRTPIDPHEDGQVSCLLGGEDVEVQAVLALHVIASEANELLEGLKPSRASLS